MGLFVRWNFILGCPTRLSKFAKCSNLLRCEWQWLCSMLHAADGLTAMFNDRVVTTQFVCARVAREC